jgi:hypothetical protein
MLEVEALDQEVVHAKALALGALREQVYDRNMAVLQQMLGEEYMFRRTFAVNDKANLTVSLLVDGSWDFF